VKELAIQGETIHLLDLGLRRRDGAQLVFPAGDLSRHGKSLGQLALVGRLGQGQEFLDFLLELDFEPVRVPVGQGAVAAGVGVELGAVKADRAELAELVGPGDL
jgi:hypothetical protein